MSFVVLMQPSRNGEDSFGFAAADPAAASGRLTPEIRPIWLVAGK